MYGLNKKSLHLLGFSFLFHTFVASLEKDDIFFRKERFEDIILSWNLDNFISRG